MILSVWIEILKYKAYNYNYQEFASKLLSEINTLVYFLPCLLVPLVTVLSIIVYKFFEVLNILQTSFCLNGRFVEWCHTGSTGSLPILEICFIGTELGQTVSVYHLTKIFKLSSCKTNWRLIEPEIFNNCCI